MLNFIELTKIKNEEKILMDLVKNPKTIKIERDAMNEKLGWLNIHKHELLSRINSSSLVDLELEYKSYRRQKQNTQYQKLI